MTVRKLARLNVTPEICSDPQQLAEALNRHHAQLAEIVDKLSAAANAPVLHPTDASGAPQARALYQGAEAPPSSLGASGDYYLRTDTPAVATQRLYVKAAGTWTGIV